MQTVAFETYSMESFDIRFYGVFCKYAT